jgi:hypothetical protein
MACGGFLKLLTKGILGSFSFVRGSGSWVFQDFRLTEKTASRGPGAAMSALVAGMDAAKSCTEASTA